MEETTPTSSSNSYIKWIAIAAVIVIILALGYFLFLRKGVNNQAQVQNPTPTTQAEMSPSPSSSASPSASAMAPSQATVVGNEFAFTPSTINAKVGEPIQITFKNEGKYAHNLTIADLNVGSKTIDPGQSDTFTVTPSKAGSFSFKCTVDSHAEKGMVGTLIVK